MADKGLLKIWQPTLQFVRFRKVNIQKPFPPHFTRAVVEHVTKPYFVVPKEKDNRVPIYEKCVGNVPYFKKIEIENPYATLLSKDLLNWFHHSKMIAIFHRNPMNSEEVYDARVVLLKQLEMRMKEHGRAIVENAVKGTKFEALLTLYQSHTVVAYGPRADAKGLLKALKKMPKLVLLGAVVEDRLLSRAELEYVSKLGELQTAQAGLVAVLNSAAQGLVTHLTHHQRQLVQHLQSHIDQQSKS